MQTIEIDDQVFTALSRRATGFHVTPNSVLRRILDLPDSAPPISPSNPTPARSSPAAVSNASIIEFIQSAGFQRSRQAVDRFLGILAWLHAANPKRFEEVVLNFHRGNRRYFGRRQQDVERSGAGITAKPIERSPFWVLTTLDNKSKRMVIEDVLQALGHSRGDINLVTAELPDSDIRRRRTPLDLYGTAGT